MNRQEMATVLSLMKMNYPSHFKSISSADASMLLDFWTKELSKFDYETVCNAVHTVIRKSEFCPTISQVLEQIKIDTRDYTLVEYEKCKICNGTGLIQYSKNIEVGGKLGVMEVTCCCRCSCAADSKSSIPTYRQVFGCDKLPFESLSSEKIDISETIAKIKHMAKRGSADV